MKIFKIYNIKNKFKIISFFALVSLLLIFSKANFESVKSSTYLFFNNILPSLFPFIFFTELILNSDIIDTLSHSLGNFIKKSLKLNKNCTPAIIIGFLCGYPMGSKTVTCLYENNKISKREANILLTFVNNCNPVFILSTIGISIFNNTKIGIILLISHYISALIICIFVTKFKSSSIIHESLSISKDFDKNNVKTKDITSLFDIIKKSIPKAFFTLLNIFGFIIIFNLLSNMVKIFLHKLNISNSIITLTTSIFEITKGCNDIFNLNIDEKLKIYIISFLLGFSGICILCQVYSTITNKIFTLKKLVISKLMQGFLSFISTYILLNLTNFSYNSLDAYKNINSSIITYSDFLNNIKITYINSIFIIITLLCVFSSMYINLHKKK